MLFDRYLVRDIKSENIFATLEKCRDEMKNLWNNIISAATDGAPAITRRYKGFVAYLKSHQHLVSTNLSESLHTSQQYVITALHVIRLVSRFDASHRCALVF